MIQIFRAKAQKGCRSVLIRTSGMKVVFIAFVVNSFPASAQTVSSSGPGPHTLGGISDVTIDFDTLSKAAPNDEDRVDSIIWGPRASIVYVANEPANGLTACHDPVEYFR